MVLTPKGVRMVFVIAMIVLLVLSVTACSAKQEEVYNYGSVEEVEPEPLPPIQIEMPDYELAYSGELEDQIIVEETEDQSGLAFSVKLSTGEVSIFTLHYNSEEGDLVTVLDAADGERVPVAFEMAEVPENLSEDDLSTFYLAQEAVNEIVESLKLK